MAPAVTSPREFEAVGDAQLGRPANWKHAGPWICFTVTLLVCLLQNVIAFDTRPNLFWDAAHYIDSARDLVTFVTQSLGGDVSGAYQVLPRAGQKVLLDGPVLPFMGAALYLVFGKTPAFDNLICFVLIQSFLHAAGALLACLLVRRLTDSNRWGIFGGLVWGLYPSAVIAAGIYMSETVTTVFLLALTWLASSLVLTEEFPKSRYPYLTRSLGVGVLAGLLLVTKPALVFGAAWVGLTTLVLTRTMRGRRDFVVAGALGALVVVAMWAAFTKWTTGQVYLTPQRVPTHNMVMGFDIESDGFGTGPGSALDELFREHDGPLAVAQAMSKAHPVEVANLLLRKPERMWSLPWNDLRRTFMGVPATYLAWWHQLLVLAAILGSLVVLSKPGAGTTATDRYTAEKRSADVIGWSALGIVLCHLIYVVFEAIPRYGFTAMPFMAILAVLLAFEAVKRGAGRRWLVWMLVPAGCWIALGLDLIPYLVPITNSLIGAVWLDAGIKIASISAAAAIAATVLGFPGEIKSVRAFAVLIVAALGVATVVAHASNGNAVREWRCKLNAGQSARRQISIDTARPAHVRLMPDWAAVLFDADRNGANARVSVNGKVLEGSPRSLYWYNAGAYADWVDIEQKANLFRKSLDSVRQWRVVHIPTAWLNLDGPNLISVEPAQGGRLTVYGDYPPAAGRKRLLAFSYAAGKVWSSVNSLEGRVLSPIPATPVEANSWLSGPGGKDSADLSSSLGVQSGDFRIHLLLGYRRATTAGDASHIPADRSGLASGTASGGTFVTELPEERFQPPLGGSLAQAAPSANAGPWHRLELPVEAPWSGRSHYLIRLKGIAMSSGSSKTASLAVILKGRAEAKPVILPGALHHVPVTAAGNSFEITDEIPYWLPKTGLAGVQVDVHAAPDVVFRGLKLEIEPVLRPDLSKDRFAVL